MRKIDTDALRQVAGSLGVGNPVTAVEDVTFDDSVLQQTLDVAGMIPGLGSESGWFGATQTHQHVASGALRNCLDIYGRVESPTGGLDFYRDAGRTDIWLYGAWASIESGTGETMNLVSAAITIPAIASSPFPGSDHEWCIMSATVFGGNPIITGGFLRATTFVTGYVQYPILIPHQARGGSSTAAGGLSMYSQSTITTNPIDARMTYLMWAGPRGHRPPRAG